MSLFSSNIRGAILQFRAGKMTKSGKTVTGDPRQGIFALVQQPSGALEVHWHAEGQPNQQEVRIVVGNVTVDRVKKCTTGRVFVIDFGGDQQLFFWLQERSDERDEEYLKTLKRHIERTSGGSAAAGASGSTAAAASSSGGGAAGASTSAAAAAAATAASIQLSTLQNILSNLGVPASASGASASPATATPASPADHSTLDLQRLLLSPQLLEAVRRDPAFYMSRLHDHLPSGTDPSDDIARHIRNPQITAAAAMLQAALSEPEGFRELTNAFSVSGTQGPAIGAMSFVQRVNAEPKNEEGANTGTAGGSKDASPKPPQPQA
jgi:26S proteasome regulatory subunit N13